MSKKMEGPWKYIPGENLPDDLAKIPEDSDMGTVLYAVPGTDVAKEAVLDAQIPQTATVDRKKASLTVEYDGEPQFQPIPTTKMTYAINTATPVIELNGTYYACDEAIWFVANSAKGPWQVATFIPDSIYTIPPESPIYNVTYVKIYDSTPEVVYVGYTPGYTNTYVYNTTIVYGTGYYYSGWYGHYYYPRPATWGFHVRWNPWTGWGIGFSYGYGPFRVTRRSDGAEAGVCGLYRRENLDAPDLGFAFLPDYRGMGFGYESSCAVLRYARDELELETVTAIVSPRNTASIALVLKLGLVFEKAIRMPGDDEDVSLYSINLKDQEDHGIFHE